MESYLKISFLNDFIFCPRSIYFHQIYSSMETRLYTTVVQIKGKQAHKSIDSKTYTTARHILQNIYVYSEKYHLCGKIDLFDTKRNCLIERKKKIKIIYDGYIFQLYAQYYCLTEMGYQIDSMKLYSLDDNKTYPVALPSNDSVKKLAFEKLISDIASFDLTTPFMPNPNKCRHCIYNNLCDCAAC